MKDGRVQPLHQPLERLLRLGGQRQLKDGRRRTEDLRQHLAGKTGSQIPRIDRTLRQVGVGGQLGALGQRDRNGRHRVRVHEQVAFGQPARKEHAVPVLVGDLLDEQVDRLRFGRRVTAVAQLAAVAAQPPAQPTLALAQVRKRRRPLDAQLFQQAARCPLGDVARSLDGALKVAAQVTV